MIIGIERLFLYNNNTVQLIKYFMCKIPLCLKKNINKRETPVSKLNNAAITIEKDFDFLSNKFSEIFTEEKPP